VTNVQKGRRSLAVSELGDVSGEICGESTDLPQAH